MSLPPGQLTEPFGTFRSARNPIGEWWHDQDGTRYHLYVVPTRDGDLLLFDPGSVGHRFVRTWFLLREDEGEIAMTYLAEKLHINPGDWPGARRLLSAALGREVF